MSPEKFVFSLIVKVLYEKAPTIFHISNHEGRREDTGMGSFCIVARVC